MTETSKFHQYFYKLADLKNKPADEIRHCKIVGTLGPASSNEKVLRELIEAGLNVVRLNFSHGEHDTHKKNIDLTRRLSMELGRPIAILQDLQGPKIRCGKLLKPSIELKKGETYELVYGAEQTAPSIIPIDYRDLVKDVAEGQRVMMDDGLIILRIEKIKGDSVFVRVEEGGTLKPRKGVNFPDAKLSIPAMTEKDSRDLLFGINAGIDFVALSFVQDQQDIINLKKMIKALGSDVPVIAKIERIGAVDCIDAIAQAADGLMVARGDLGVEGDVEKVPGYQKRIIEAAARNAKPVIVATQMLESMVDNPRATLAELSDVANGVLDGADCLMLSAEVASGKYPVVCVQTMASVVKEVEHWTFRRPERHSVVDEQVMTEDHEAIARAACEAADVLNAKLIICLTLTGSIARTMAKWRPKTPILAISPRKEVIQRLSLVWGVYALQNPLFYDTDDLLADLPELLKTLDFAASGDKVVITAGIPLTQVRPSNMIKISVIP